MAFETKIRRARVVYSGFSSETMARIGTTLRDSISQRIHRGRNVNDGPARPLKPGRITSRGRQAPGYPDFKARKGLQPIRDWVSFYQPKTRMKTLAAMQVKEASENRAVIGFIDPKADVIAHINNQRERQFGVSPSDRAALVRAVAEEKSPMKWGKVA